MTGTGIRRRWIVLAFVLAVLGVAGAVARSGYVQALGQLALRADSDLSLASDRLRAQLLRYQELAVLMADHPALRDLETPERRAQARALLLKVADKTAARGIDYADRSGQVLVSSHGAPGASVAQTAPFRRAMQGALGVGHRRHPVGDQRSSVYAAPAFGDDGRVRGALIVALDVVDVEQNWPGNAPTVFFTDPSGAVFVSNRSELLDWSRGAGARDGAPGVFESHRVGAHEIWTMRWGAYIPRAALHVARDLPVIGLHGEILVDVAPARRLALLQGAVVAAICLAFGALLFLATERRRTLAEANAALESRVTERTEALSRTNMRLRREVSERQEAQAALQQAQADLVQAGKLSALGQMSAGISHELNQPLMAIQSFADNGAVFLERGQGDKTGENLGRISDLARRMGRIIKNLRAFARNESEPMGKVDLVQVINTAVELTAARLKADTVTMDWVPNAAPVYAWGGEVRLVQVFVNLINNAADAMLEQDERYIRIVINNSRKRLAVTVRDLGPGIKEPEKIFEPFYSTKTVGSSEGMGLGLSISYGLVQSFGGDIRGRNATRGAMFTVDLEYWTQEKVA
ncbi:MAG: ATP-binding protein [Sedimentitalea sp.]